VSKMSFVFLLVALLSLGAADLCSAQWGPTDWERDFPHQGLRRDRAHQLPISLSERRMLKPGKANTIFGIIKDDFLVNDDRGTFSQVYPAVAMDTSGNFVICWQDERNGDWGDIYAQRYSSSGDLLGVNFRVNYGGAGEQCVPSIAMDANGDFVICWQDGRNDGDIYAQRYSNSGDPLGANFRVNADVGTDDQLYPTVAMDGNGNFVICWLDYRNDFWNPDIYAQKYDSSGDRLGVNFRVNDRIGVGGQSRPSIAVGEDGNFVICWQDERNADWGDIYAQRYNSSGDTLGANFRVNDDNETSGQYLPSISMDGDDGFVICWVDKRRGYDDIYAQRYRSSGDTLGRNFRVNDYVGMENQWYPTIAMDANGDFVICWQDHRYNKSSIYAQRYNSSGDTLGANFLVNDSVAIGSRGAPSVSMDVNGNSVICWTDARNGDADIYAQRYNSSGNTADRNFRVNDDVGGKAQIYPSIAMDTDGDFVICWQDGRNGDWDIYAQCYSSSGDTLGTNFRVNNDVGKYGQWSPSISMHTNGNFVICWCDYPNGNSDIYAQRYSSSGDTVGANFRVNDDVGKGRQGDPSIAVAVDGYFVICWQDERNGDSDIYAQRFDSSGDTLCPNFRVNDDIGTNNQWHPSIAMDIDGDFVICWQDEHNDYGDIYAQRYNPKLCITIYDLLDFVFSFFTKALVK